MKKIFYCLLLAVMLSSCGGETKKSEAKQESNPNAESETRQELVPNAESETKQEPSPEVAVEKQVGDIIMVNGAMGIVYAVTPDGQHGMVVSVAEGFADFEAAKQWCAQYGNGWQLPSDEELLVILKEIEALDLILKENGYTELSGKGCWATIPGTDGACVVQMSDGYTSIDYEKDSRRVRAVCEF